MNEFTKWEPLQEKEQGQQPESKTTAPAPTLGAPGSDVMMPCDILTSLPQVLGPQGMPLIPWHPCVSSAVSSAMHSLGTPA